MVVHDKLLAVFETRFDYYSARAVLGDALRKAGVAEAKSYGPDQLKAIAAAVAGVAKADVLAATLAGMGDTGKHAAPEPAPEPAPRHRPRKSPRPRPRPTPPPRTSRRPRRRSRSGGSTVASTTRTRPDFRLNPARSSV